jgi:hypothetical protein
MSLASCQAILGMGGFFILLGLAFILWNRREKKKYYNSILLTQRDMKEFMTHEPERPWLSAWQIGGRISLIIGIMLAIAGGVLWLVLY